MSESQNVLLNGVNLVRFIVIIKRLPIWVIFILIFQKPLTHFTSVVELRPICLQRLHSRVHVVRSLLLFREGWDFLFG